MQLLNEILGWCWIVDLPLHIAHQGWVPPHKEGTNGVAQLVHILWENELMPIDHSGGSHSILFSSCQIRLLTLYNGHSLIISNTLTTREYIPKGRVFHLETTYSYSMGYFVLFVHIFTANKGKPQQREQYTKHKDYYFFGRHLLLFFGCKYRNKI